MCTALKLTPDVDELANLDDLVDLSLFISLMTFGTLTTARRNANVKKMTVQVRSNVMMTRIVKEMKYASKMTWVTTTASLQVLQKPTLLFLLWNLLYVQYSTRCIHLLNICLSTDFSECSVRADPEYRTFDKMKHNFRGDHSYVLVRTKNLPNNLPDVYIVGVNSEPEESDEDSEEDHDNNSSEESRIVDNEDVDDEDEDNSDETRDADSKNEGSRYKLQELKVVVYNHTVELKKNRKLYVSISGVFNKSSAHLSYCFTWSIRKQQTQHGIASVEGF